MSSLDFEIDAQMSELESQWRFAYDAANVARADYRVLAANPRANAQELNRARERIERAETARADVMQKIDQLEIRFLGSIWPGRQHGRDHADR
jgi:hypothetical protein